MQRIGRQATKDLSYLNLDHSLNQSLVEMRHPSIRLEGKALIPTNTEDSAGNQETEDGPGSRDAKERGPTAC